MRTVIQWAVRNSPAMNTLMISVILVGLICMFSMRREVFPEFELEIVLVTVPYPGATPEEIEEGICQKIEEAVRAISGIKKITSIAQEGVGHVVVELLASVRDVQKVLNEVRSEVDRIPSFPALAEDPEVKQITIREPAIYVAVVGPDRSDLAAELDLRAVAERVRDDLLELPSVSQAEVRCVKDYQIDIEIPESTLRKHGLTLQQVAAIVRRENVELPGGTLKTLSQEVLLRGQNKQLVGEEIARLPLVSTPEGSVLSVGDLGVVRDEFADTSAISRVNGQPGLVISVNRTSEEDLLRIADEVRQYVAAAPMPTGYALTTWGDRSVDVRDRIDLLVRNGWQGLLLVFIVLALFLDLKLAFWVAMGIPISILGACGALLYFGQTLNMLSLFAFLMALGILVDDAIVVGENIFEHRQQGKGFVQAAIDGTVEVIPSVVSSILTTVIAFTPLMFVSGVMGKFIAVMPLAVIAMLLISLLESSLVLPCHLAHERGLLFRLFEVIFYPFRFVATGFSIANVRLNQFLDWFIDRYYRPTLLRSLNNPWLVLSGAVSILLLSLGMVISGITPWNIFPKLDSNWIQAKVTYPDGTPESVTDAATVRLEEAIEQLNQEFTDMGMPLVQLTYRVVGQVTGSGTLGPDSRSDGSHIGEVQVELVDTSLRNVDSQQIIARWRELAGEFPGTQSLTYGIPAFGPGGTPIEFKLLAPNDAESLENLESAVEACKQYLAQIPGVFDVTDDSQPGKSEFQLRIRDQAVAMGITLGELAETVRAAFYGEEVMRLQRGRHEVKLMVRYPLEDRQSLANFEELRVRGSDGLERPLTELADINVVRGYSEINRVDQMRSITVKADLDESVGNAARIVAEMRRDFMPELLAKTSGVRVRWEGQQEQTNESLNSLLLGFIVAMVGMFVLLTVEFRSYFQPFLIMIIIPFGAVGAIWGHALMGLPLTLFSVFGLVALAGVVVNDSIVLIDFINHRIRDGLPLKEALVDACCRRLRPVMLTSVTTVAGLLPLLTERSFQAQVLVPMATSMCFGLLLTTVLVLLLMPALYLLYAHIVVYFTGHFGKDELEIEVDRLVKAPTNVALPS